MKLRHIRCPSKLQPGSFGWSLTWFWARSSLFFQTKFIREHLKINQKNIWLFDIFYNIVLLGFTETTGTIILLKHIKMINSVLLLLDKVWIAKLRMCFLSKTIYNASNCFIQVNIFCFYLHSVLNCQRLYLIIKKDD